MHRQPVEDTAYPNSSGQNLEKQFSLLKKHVAAMQPPGKTQKSDMPKAAQTQPKLERLADPKAFAAWKLFWTFQLRALGRDATGDKEAAIWLCLHTGGEVATLVQSQPDLDTPAKIYGAIRAASIMRLQIAKPPQAAIYDLAIIGSETPRTFVKRATDYADLYNIDDAITMSAIRNATTSLSFIRAVTHSATTTEEWLQALSIDAERRFDAFADYTKTAGSAQQQADVAALGPQGRTRGRGGGRGRGGRGRGRGAGPSQPYVRSRTPGLCHRCNKPGHYARDCLAAAPIAAVAAHERQTSNSTSTSDTQTGYDENDDYHESS